MKATKDSSGDDVRKEENVQYKFIEDTYPDQRQMNDQEYKQMYKNFNEKAFQKSASTGEIEVSHIPEKAFAPNEKIDAQLRKVFVGGLPHNLELSQFRAYFQRFGTIDDIVIL